MPTVTTDRALTVVRWPCGCALTFSKQMDRPEEQAYFSGDCGERYGLDCLVPPEPRAVALKVIAHERQRRQRNTDARARYDALRSLGLTRTPYGWE